MPAIDDLSSSKPSSLSAKVVHQKSVVDFVNSPLETLVEHVRRVESAAEEHRIQSEHTECLQLASSLVNLYANMVVMPILQTTYKGPLKFTNWYDDIRGLVRLSYLPYTPFPLRKKIDILLKDIRQIVWTQGRIKAHQWNTLMFLSVSMNGRDLCQTDEKTLERVATLASNRFKDYERLDTVNALVRAIKQSAPSTIIKTEK